MAEHTHPEFTLIDKTLTGIDKKQDKMVETVDKIFARIEGKNGITSEIAVLKTRWQLMPSVKTLVFYSSVGGGLTVAGFLIIKHLVG